MGASYIRHPLRPPRNCLFWLIWHDLPYSDAAFTIPTSLNHEPCILTRNMLFWRQSVSSDKDLGIPTKCMTFRQMPWHSDKYPDIPTIILTFRQSTRHFDKCRDVPTKFRIFWEVPTNTLTFRQKPDILTKNTAILTKTLTFRQKIWHSDKIQAFQQFSKVWTLFKLWKFRQQAYFI